MPSGRGALCTTQLLRAVRSWVSQNSTNVGFGEEQKDCLLFLKHQRVPPAAPHSSSHRSQEPCHAESYPLCTENPDKCSDTHIQTFRHPYSNIQTPIFKYSDTQLMGTTSWSEQRGRPARDVSVKWILSLVSSSPHSRTSAAPSRPTPI